MHIPMFISAMGGGKMGVFIVTEDVWYQLILHLWIGGGFC
jgi:hypothetical protein